MIKIFGKDNCPQCLTAQQLCTANKIEFEYLSLGKDYSAEKAQSISRLTGTTSFPFIFRGDEFIGGAKDLHQLLKRA